MAFQPGESGNPGGRPKAKEWADALRVAVKRADGDRTVLAAIAERVASEALNGNMVAAKEIGDRLDGKPPQAIVGDDDADPVRVLHRIERIIVQAPDRDSEGV